MFSNLKDIECFIFDMDGTLYLEEQLIEGTLELLDYLNKNNKEYYFLTNNSSKTNEDYFKKLNSLGLDFISKSQIITSGDITIEYIKNNFISKPKIYLIATNDIKNEFIKNEIKVVETYGENIDAVVVTFDTSFDYEKASIATRYLRKGVPFIATHLDIVCPIKNNEFIPDCGAISKMLEISSGTKAKFIGKPCKETVDYILNKTSIPKDKIAVVGDRLYTDIATGVNNGMLGIAVLTGETTLDEINKSDIKPSYIFESVKELKIELEK